VPTSTTLPTSPLAALVGAPQSALPIAPTVATPPTRLSIGVIGVDVPIRAVGVQPDGQLEIPDETEVGWYGLGSAPGAPGTTVFAAHVNWHGRPGPFLRLSELEPGAEVIVTSADGTSRTYSVTERAQYPKASLPTERVWSRSGPETLVLITCGGDFDATQRRFRDNVVVYAVPIATAAAGS
jgi:sortase (surface protein transpeptidase)